MIYALFVFMFMMHQGVCAMEKGLGRDSDIDIFLESCVGDQGRIIEPEQLLSRVLALYENQLHTSSKVIHTSLRALPLDEYNHRASSFMATRAVSNAVDPDLQAEALGFLVTELGRLVNGRDVDSENEKLEKTEIKILNDSVMDLTKIALVLKDLTDKKQKRYDELEKQHAEVVQKLSRSKIITLVTAGNAVVALAVSNLLNYFFSH